MKNKPSYQPVDLQHHPDFEADVLSGKDLLMIPSQGEHGTRIITGQEGEMRYEQRQAGEVTKPDPGIFVSRCQPPRAEADYQKLLFGDRTPEWHVPSAFEQGKPLDRIVLGDPSFLHRLGEVASDRRLTLYGFHETEEMGEIADQLGVEFYGNPEFASWAGTKIGLEEFAAECGVRTPPTHSVHSLGEVHEAAKVLADVGYSDVSIKVSHSSGSMGHRVRPVSELLKAVSPRRLAELMPEEFIESEGAVIQGWIPQGEAVSLSSFVDFDGRYTFTGAQIQLLGGEAPPGSSGAIPLDSQHLEKVLETGHRVAKGYARHRAYGPHAMDMIIPAPEICDRLGLDVGEPLCHDENTRVGAAAISRAWLLAITEGRYGVGWKDSKVSVPRGATTSDVIGRLDEVNLLIKKTGPEVSGVFVYNGAVLDYGHENACYALAISGNDDYKEASALLEDASRMLKGA